MYSHLVPGLQRIVYQVLGGWFEGMHCTLSDRFCIVCGLRLIALAAQDAGDQFRGFTAWS
jgi:hypothetical protein